MPLQPVTAPAKGVVDPAAAQRAFRLARYLPEGPLAAYLDHFWLVEWDLRGRAPHPQRTLPYPVVNLVFQAGRTAVFGPMRGAFEIELHDRGCALGLRFRPGAFRALLDAPVHRITDTTVPLSQVLPVSDDAAEAAVLGAPDDAAKVAAAHALLVPHLPPPDPQVERVAALLASAEASRELTRVEQLAAHAGASVRSLQQLFSEYVGLSPKWVIRRYRLHDAAARLAAGEAIDLALLAQQLGYYDQAHLTREFKAVVGRTPAEYRRAAAGAR